MIRSQALLLVGHGAALNADSSAPVYAHAARIRRRRLFSEVHTAFWKEDPPIRGAPARISATDVFVVPVLLADGYFASQVVPRELAVVRGPNRRGAQTVHYCPPVGTHPAMDALVLRRARQAAPLSRADRRRGALLVVGHGTERDRKSGDVVRAIVKRLRKSCDYGQVDFAFLDEDPRLNDVVADIDVRHVVLVPFLLADGWHTGETIPRDLGLAGPRTERDGRVLWYAKPVGTLPEVADVVVEIAQTAGGSVGLTPPTRPAPRGPPRSARCPPRARG
jgi:sirohydrochlorin cobaltochelatase